jgi:predicted ATPase
MAEASYQFKHALVQDAAHASLLRTRRQQLHGDFARALETQFPDVALTEPETLAHHLTEAGRADAALRYWLRAGQRAAERSADQEAVRHLQRGIALLETLPPSAERDRIELDFQVTLGTPLASVLGYANAKVSAAAERATVLAERLGEAAVLFAPLYAQYTYLYITGRTRTALEIAQRLNRLGASRADRVMQMMANRALGVVVTQLGDFPAGRGHFEQALALHDRERDGSLAARFLTDPFASTSALLSLTLWVSGHPGEATRMLQQALGAAESLQHVHTAGLVHHFAAHLEALAANPAGVLLHTEAMIGLAQRHKVDAWRSHWTIWEGWARGQLGDHADGIARMREGIAMQDARSQTYHVAYYTSLMAQLHVRAGAIEEALEVHRDARERARATEEGYWEAELRRCEGECRGIAGHPAADVEACFSAALALGRQQGAKMFELRAASSLARLWLEQGRHQEARDLLSPIHAWFTDSLGCADLLDAKALLDRSKA